jgi:hypothetical protein
VLGLISKKNLNDHLKITSDDSQDMYLRAFSKLYDLVYVPAFLQRHLFVRSSAQFISKYLDEDIDNKEEIHGRVIYQINRGSAEAATPTAQLAACL